MTQHPAFTHNDNMDLIQQGIKQGLIQFDEEQKNIFYVQQNKKYRYTDPEEQIRAKNYCSLVINYGYPKARIDFEVKVPHRTPNNLADIVVYDNDELTAPIIVVECKKPDISEAEFTQAIEQGFGNANSIKAKFLWITEGVKENFYNVADYPSMERNENKIADHISALRTLAKQLQQQAAAELAQVKQHIEHLILGNPNS